MDRGRRGVRRRRWMDYGVSLFLLLLILLSIELPVKFVKRLRDKIAMYKHRGHLECQVSRANAQVKWYKNKVEIKPSKKYEIKSEDVYRKLTINDVDSGDEDTYTCDAIDEKTSCKLLVEGTAVDYLLACQPMYVKYCFPSLGPIPACLFYPSRTVYQYCAGA